MKRQTDRFMQFLRDFTIGRKLTIGFGVLVMLIFVVIAIAYSGSRNAQIQIANTKDVRVPISELANNARANLLRMLSSTRAYLALGEPRYLIDYELAEADFRRDLNDLRLRANELDAENVASLERIEQNFAVWENLPEQLFTLRDDQIEREPAYKILALEGVRYVGNGLQQTNLFITEQKGREATEANMGLLADMAQFQSSFASMLSGLRNYVTTQNRIYRQEYEANLGLNEIAWTNLQEAKANGLLTETQIEMLKKIETARNDFLALPEDRIFPILDSGSARADLALFSKEVVPLNESMEDELEALTENQHLQLERELTNGSQGLETAVTQTLIFGGVALAVGLFLSVGLRALISGPVQRLTLVAEQITDGDLNAKAAVESADEIGILARTFNNMTDRLRNTLRQVRKERDRADSLLDVVIPIGVQLVSEKDYDRLLEKMLVEAQTFCHANAGILYLRQENKDTLDYVIVRNNSAAVIYGGTHDKNIPYDSLSLHTKQEVGQKLNIAVYSALTGETVNIPDAQHHQGVPFDFTGPSNVDTDYYATSYLNIPLKNSENYVLGVMQLMDPLDVTTQKVVPFDENLQRMMESFSSLAVAGLEAYIRERALRQEIKKLRIEIDDAKKEKQVSEIVDSADFLRIREQAQQIRQRRASRRESKEDN